MTTAALPRHNRRDRVVTVDLAGAAWPLYKLEAIAAAVLTFLLVLIVAQSLQASVLTAAGVAVVVWWVRRAMLSAPSASPPH